MWRTWIIDSAQKNECEVSNSTKHGHAKRIRRQVKDWQKIFVKDVSDKILLSKIYKEFLKINNLIHDGEQRSDLNVGYWTGQQDFGSIQVYFPRYLWGGKRELVAPVLLSEDQRREFR